MGLACVLFEVVPETYVSVRPLTAKGSGSTPGQFI